jgi:hypothetical protein
MNDVGPRAQMYLTENGIYNIVAFDGRYIDPAKTGKVNSDVLTEAIKKQYPDPNTSGIASLDWEGELYNNLRGKASPSSPEYKSALSEFIKAIQIAKALRPNIKWGYYAVPFTIHENDDKRLRTLNDNITTLLEQ